MVNVRIILREEHDNEDLIHRDASDSHYLVTCVPETWKRW